MLIGPDEGQVSYDQNNHSQMIQELQLRNFLMQNCDLSLSLLPQLIQSILFLQYLDLWLPPSCLWLVRHCRTQSLVLSSSRKCHIPSGLHLLLLILGISGPSSCSSAHSILLHHHLATSCEAPVHLIVKVSS